MRRLGAWGFAVALALGCFAQDEPSRRGGAGGESVADAVLAVGLSQVERGTVPSRSPREAGLAFTDITESAGLVEPLRCMMGHAAAFGDIDADGLPDLVYGTFAQRPAEEYLCEGGPRPDRLFRNAGDGRFLLESSAAVEQFGRASGAVLVDLDGDGDLDAVITHNARARGGPVNQLSNVLIRNDGGAFTDVSHGSGLQVGGMSARNVIPFDYDGDGELDLFIVEDKFTGTGSKLFRKRAGVLAYEDVTSAAGLPTDLLGLGAAVADVNNDGWADLYVSDIDRLFVFDPATGRFRHESSLDATFDWSRRNDEDWTAGVAFGDVNRDGRLDLVVTHHFDSAHDHPLPPRLYLNRTSPDGQVSFQRIDGALGGIGAKAPHAEIQDLDNDGWPDIYLSVHVDVEGRRMPLVYRHNGSAVAPEFHANSLDVSPPEKNRNYGAAGPTADIDRDGRLDMLITEWWPDQRSVLYRNTSEAGNYLEVKVRRANPMGIGSKVYVYEPGRLGMSDGLIGLVEINVGFGYSSGQEAVAHFGVANRDRVDVRVILPHDRGTIDRSGVAVNQRLTVD